MCNDNKIFFPPLTAWGAYNKVEAYKKSITDWSCLVVLFLACSGSFWRYREGCWELAVSRVSAPLRPRGERPCSVIGRLTSHRWFSEAGPAARLNRPQCGVQVLLVLLRTVVPFWAWAAVGCEVLCGPWESAAGKTHVISIAKRTWRREERHGFIRFCFPDFFLLDLHFHLSWSLWKRLKRVKQLQSKASEQ